VEKDGLIMGIAITDVLKFRESVGDAWKGLLI
jgi:hypothetical protein